MKVNFNFKYGSEHNMKNSAEYKTKQKAALERAVVTSAGAHITVDGLTASLEQTDTAVGRTTVYRYLERLAEKGIVRKYIQAGESACYQYVGDRGECKEHFHLKCEQCGRLIHIECSHLEELSRHIEASHGFRINKLKTVLYGICEDCASNEK